MNIHVTAKDGELLLTVRDFDSVTQLDDGTVVVHPRTESSIPEVVTVEVADPPTLNLGEPLATSPGAIQTAIDCALADDYDLRILYQGERDDTPRWRTVRPQNIAEKNGGAFGFTTKYLLAYDHAAGGLRKQYRLDRITGAEAA